MPTYEYACRQCGEHLEVFQSFKEDPLETCGLCGGDLRKVFSAAGIIFKGSGYYVTDSRDGGKSKGKASSGSEAAESDTKSDDAKGDGAKSDSTTSDGGGTKGSKSDSGSGSSSSGSGSAAESA